MANETVGKAAKKAGGFLAEFKEFALKGNVMDMAVGVIIGGAFGTIVTALTDSFITPLIQAITGSSEVQVGGEFVINGAHFTYGAFISAVINFLILALILFCLIKAINKAMSIGKKQEEEAAAPPEPTKEELLLTEIRDLLKENAEK
ncbi:MAG: large conductance mechanosensitive channel protein MscL [Oscillospiraceae bacterium]|nr:large conductance mechanosensitive channel protein MscL [Oscillospiraceae bacterium]